MQSGISIRILQRRKGEEDDDDDDDEVKNGITKCYNLAGSRVTIRRYSVEATHIFIYATVSVTWN